MKLGVDTKLMAFSLLQSLPCTPECQIFQSPVINTIEENKLTFDAVEIWINAEVARQSGKAPGGSESALKSEEKWCDFHKVKSHNTLECRTLQSAEKGQRKKGKERHKDKGKEKEKANTAEQSSGSDSEKEQSHIALEHVHISKLLAKRIQAYLVNIPCSILQATVGKKDYNIALSNVLLVPNFMLALVSVHKLSKTGLSTLFPAGSNACEVRKKEELILTALHK
ncbi:hypothetical protein SERLADRAFT_443732 [Serpula lacrymans var. lacrymans S7.9]|uniref:Uncharacterized protein n=1 Tax=Serpula lacrymans var. lacrymans (strain S7.9) TaxID=578457 RepID=F8PDE2_SERL9|nr:uncharacterized protein SERLADRAFT_443732 [Serpula lacrymans var. lacrymans S7.9]EGO18763.1 hypothetical protein SERLADRAFT_443732 [Serpula lacrymans var. lacrymans S7.9]